MRSSCLVIALAALSVLMATGCAQTAGRDPGDAEEPAVDGGRPDRPDPGRDAGGHGADGTPPALRCDTYAGETDLDGDGIPVADDPRIDLAFWSQEGFSGGRGDIPVRTAGGTTMAELSCHRRAEDCTPELVVVSGGRAGRFGALLVAPDLGPDAISDYRTGITEDGTVWVLSYTSLWDSPHPGAIIDAWRLSVVRCGRAAQLAEGGPAETTPEVSARPGGGLHLRQRDDEVIAVSRWVGDGLEPVARGGFVTSAALRRGAHFAVTRDGRRRLIADPPVGPPREVLDAPAEGTDEGPFTLRELRPRLPFGPPTDRTRWHCAARDDGSARFVEVDAEGVVRREVGPIDDVHCAGALLVRPDGGGAPWAAVFERGRAAGEAALVRLAAGESRPRLDGYPGLSVELFATEGGWYVTSGTTRGRRRWLYWLPGDADGGAVRLVAGEGGYGVTQLDVAPDGRAAAILRDPDGVTRTMAIFDGARRIRDLSFDAGVWLAGRGVDGLGDLRLIVGDGPDDRLLRLVSAWATDREEGAPLTLIEHQQQLRSLGPDAPDLYAVCRTGGVCGVHDLALGGLRTVPGQSEWLPQLLTRGDFDGVGPDGAVWVRARVDGVVGSYALDPERPAGRLVPGSTSSLDIGLADGPTPVPWVVARLVGSSVEVRQPAGDGFELLASGERQNLLRRMTPLGPGVAAGLLLSDLFLSPHTACLFDRRPACVAFPDDVGQMAWPAVADADHEVWALLHGGGGAMLWHSVR